MVEAKLFTPNRPYDGPPIWFILVPGGYLHKDLIVFTSTIIEGHPGPNELHLAGGFWTNELAAQEAAAVYQSLLDERKACANQ